MSRQLLLNSINLAHGPGRQNVFGGVATPTVGTTQSNSFIYRQLMNQINYGSFTTSFVRDSSSTKKGWS